MKRIAAVALLVLMTIPAGPARADCTRLGSITIGECRKKRKKKPQPADPQDIHRAPSAEEKLLELVNDERRARGLNLLVLDANARDVARRHSRRMARAGREYHNGDLDSRETRDRLGNPRSIGENVGYGPGAGSIHEAFMGSDSHRANILGRYDRIGIGVIVDGRTYWVTEVFTEGAQHTGGGGGAGLAGVARPGERDLAGALSRLPPEEVATAATNDRTAGTSSSLPWGAMVGVVVASTVPGALRRTVRRRRPPS